MCFFSFFLILVAKYTKRFIRGKVRIKLKKEDDIMTTRWIKVLFVASLISLSLNSFATLPTHAAEAKMDWLKNIGGSGSDMFYSVKQTSDGGYIAAGATASSNGDLNNNKGSDDALIVKLDDKGSITWIKNIGGSSSEYFNTVQQTSDGGYIAAGYSQSSNGDIGNNKGELDALIVKLDGNGNIVWLKNVGGSKSESFEDAQQTSDGGYIAVGYSNSNDGDLTSNRGYDDAILVKFDTNGNITWIKSIGGSSGDQFYSVQQTSDGGYIAAGNSGSTNGNISGNKGNTDGILVKFDASGNTAWIKNVGGSSNDYLRSVQQTSDGGYISSGYSSSNNGDITGPKGLNDGIVTKFDASGNISWLKNIGGTLNDNLYSVVQTSDGGYIATGESKSVNGDIAMNKGNTDAIIVKLDQSGNITWLDNIGGSGIDTLYSIIFTNEGYVAAGSSYSTNGDITNPKGSGDAIIVKYVPVDHMIGQTVVKTGISPGVLSIVSPAIQSGFNNITLNGQINTTRASLTSFDVTDFTAKGEGWQVTVQASNFNEKAPDGTWDTEGTRLSLPAGVLSLQPVSLITTTSGSSQPPTSTLAAKTVIDNGGAIKLIGADIGKGLGGYTVGFPANALELTLPANIKTDSINYPNSPTVYESTMSWTIVTGP